MNVTAYLLSTGSKPVKHEKLRIVEKDSNSNGNQEIDATEHESEIGTDGSNENLPEMSQSQINRRPKKTKINDFVVTSSTTINDNQKRDSLINDYRQIFNEDRITYLLRFPSLLQTYMNSSNIRILGKLLEETVIETVYTKVPLQAL